MKNGWAKRTGSVFNSLRKAVCMIPSEKSLSTKLEIAEKKLQENKLKNVSLTEENGKLKEENGKLKVSDVQLKKLQPAYKQLIEENKKLKGEIENRGIVDPEKAKEALYGAVGMGAGIVGATLNMLGEGTSAAGKGFEAVQNQLNPKNKPNKAGSGAPHQKQF